MSFILVDDRVGAAKSGSQTAAAASGSPVATVQRVSTSAGLADARPQYGIAAPSTLPSGRNRRWSQRNFVRLSGTIGSGTSPTPVGCAVVDLSKHGAMLDLEAETDLPECFVLVFYNRRTRCEANCVVRWRRDGRVGVCFAGPVRSSISRQ